MNNVQTAITAIRNMNTDEIDQVVEAVKLQRTFLARSTARGLSVGDRVEFDGRTGRVVGHVEKVNRKTVLVRALDGTRWKVTASLLNTQAA
jgi:tetrahydromethanopterin S-methyltransferase subunit F